MNRRYILYTGLFVLIILGILISNGEYEPKYTEINSKNMFFEEDYVLKSTKDVEYSNDSLKNYYTYVFFGYTNCPDFCPDTLIKIHRLFDELRNENIKQNIKMLFISVDTKDSLNKIKKYVEYFDNDFIGVSMDKEKLDQLTKRVGVYYKKVSSDGNIDFYDHTGAIFLINKKAKLIGLYTPPILIKEMKEDIIKGFK
tara:strand:+ start:75 stop:668 length:594 start_codon:yes stop_codon:yes gene_type:complete